MTRLLLSLALLLALPAHAGWSTGTVGTGAVQWTPPSSGLTLVSTTSGQNEAVSLTITGQSWNAGDVVVVLAGGMDGQSPTNANLTFTQAVQATDTSSRRAAMWTAVAGSSQAAQTVTMPRGTLSAYAAGTVLVFSGASSSFTNTATSGVPSDQSTNPASLTINGTTAGSIIVGVIQGGSAVTWTPSGGLTEISDLTLIGDSVEVLRQTGTSSGGNVTFTTTPSSGAQWTMCAIEIKSP